MYLRSALELQLIGEPRLTRSAKSQVQVCSLGGNAATDLPARRKEGTIQGPRLTLDPALHAAQKTGGVAYISSDAARALISLRARLLCFPLYNIEQSGEQPRQG